MTEQFFKWEFGDEKYYWLILHAEISEYLGRIFEHAWIINMKLVKKNHEHIKFSLTLYRNVDYVENIDDKKIEIIIKSGILTILNTAILFKSNRRSCYIGNIEYDPNNSPPVQVIMKFIKMDMQDKKKSNMAETSLNTQTSSEESDLCCTKELSEDFQAMTFEENLSDVTVRCNSISFKAHKQVLCARSPVFKAMFTREAISKPCSQEKATDTVTLDDEDPETVLSLIQFIYSGRKHIHSIKEATSLLDLAEKYQIQSLKDGLIEYFKSKLSLQNAALILELANLYDKNLKENAIEFIGKHFDTLKKEQSWKDLKSSKPLLALEVYDHLH